MKFRFVRKGKTNAPVYQGQKASTGDVVEFTGTFVAKAIRNPDFEALQSPEKAAKKASKKRASKKKVSRG